MDEEQLEAMREHLALLVNEGKPENQFWEPDLDIEQAFMCLDAMGTLFNISGEPGFDNFNCWIEDGEEGAVADGCKTLPLAICIAACRATGMEI